MTAGRRLEHSVKALLTASVSKVARMKHKGNDKKEGNISDEIKWKAQIVTSKN
jgi:hypothetical protein